MAYLFLFSSKIKFFAILKLPYSLQYKYKPPAVCFVHGIDFWCIAMSTRVFYSVEELIVAILELEW